jgi:hypothetical protein
VIREDSWFVCSLWLEFDYAVAIRGRKPVSKGPLLDSSYFPIALGQPLPMLPIWMDAELGVFLDLETSYEDACRVLRIP